LAREARHQFCSKKVRISSNKRTSIKLSGILPIDSAARSAAENGNTGSPRTARLAAFFDNFKFFFGGKFFRPITDKNNEFIS